MSGADRVVRGWTRLPAAPNPTKVDAVSADRAGARAQRPHCSGPAPVRCRRVRFRFVKGNPLRSLEGSRVEQVAFGFHVLEFLGLG